MVELYITDTVDNIFDFDKDIALPVSGEYAKYTGTSPQDFKAVAEDVRIRLLKAFKVKGLDKRPSWWRRIIFGAKRAVRIDIDDNTKEVLLTNGLIDRGSGLFVPNGWTLIQAIEYMTTHEEANG